MYINNMFIEYKPQITPEIIDSEEYANLTMTQISRLLTEKFMSERLYVYCALHSELDYKNKIECIFSEVKNKLILELKQIIEFVEMSTSLLTLIAVSNCNIKEFIPPTFTKFGIGLC